MMKGKATKIIFILILLFMPEKIQSFSSVNNFRNFDLLKEISTKNPNGIRIFHPAFPSQILTPISQAEVQNIVRVKELTGFLDQKLDISSIPQLPWKIFPEIGISESTNFKSKSELLELYEKNRHQGEFVW